MYNSYGCYDRRRYQRLNLNLSVFYKVDTPVYIRVMLGDREIEATTLNISQGGMAFLTDYEIPEESLLHLKFNLFKIDREGQINVFKPVIIKGEVRSSNVFENKRYRIGICFVRQNCEITREIGDFVKQAA